MNDADFNDLLLAIAKRHRPGSNASVELAFEEWLRDALEDAFREGGLSALSDQINRAT